jgi:hypothetical protein
VPVGAKLRPISWRGQPGGPPEQQTDCPEDPQWHERRDFEQSLHKVYSDAIADLIDNLRGDQCLKYR